VFKRNPCFPRAASQGSRLTVDLPHHAHHRQYRTGCKYGSKACAYLPQFGHEERFYIVIGEYDNNLRA
jgi:hypothetical protein